MSDRVIRYVATYVNEHGERTLMGPSQGRCTFEKREGAQGWIDAVTGNNSESAVRQVWGDNPRFEVRECPCYPGHFDPMTVWFDV